MVILNKKGELQTQETILSVFIFVVIIIISMTLFFRYQENNLRNEARDFRLDQLGNKILTIPDSAEFVYTESGAKKDAIDNIKLIALQNLVKRKKNYYNEKFGYANITIIQVYPLKNKNKCSAGNIKECGIWEIYNNLPKEGISTKIRKETPVSLYFPAEGKYSIGILIVEAYNV